MKNNINFRKLSRKEMKQILGGNTDPELADEFAAKCSTKCSNGVTLSVDCSGGVCTANSTSVKCDKPGVQEEKICGSN